MVEKVAVAMSGGVDSSTAAAILVDQGYEVVGFSMQLWNQRRNAAAHAGESKFGRCCSLDDLYDARQVANLLGIPYYVLNYERDFVSSVIRPFIENYMSGLTPSPCVLCNTHLKFDRLLTLAQQIDALKVATGHYARVEHDAKTRRFILKKGVDLSKDQSYFLFELKQWQLERTIFPLGGLRKPEIRRVARAKGLPVAEKPDSQEICFVSSKNYSDFIEEHHEEIVPVGTKRVFEPGNIVDKAGKILGTHQGIVRYTIGQRKGLRIAAGAPLYVIGIDPQANEVIVGGEDELYQSRLIAERVNWILFDSLERPIEVKAKIRSRHEETAAMISPTNVPNQARVEFDEPQRAITPGQAVVFYQEDVVVGGGWISPRSSMFKV